jgi:CBS domain-containing protein
MLKSSIKEYMRTDVPSVDIDDTFDKIVDFMIDKDLDFVVVRSDGEIVGVISDQEICTCIAQGRDLKKLRAREFMDACRLAGVTPCLQLNEHETVINAIKTMSTTGVRYILVTGESGVKGVISFHDLIRAVRS